MYCHIYINKKKYMFLLLALLLFIPLGKLYLTIAPRFPLLFPECGMKTVFHLYCPGCGGTRAILSLLKLHLFDSFMCNPFVLYAVIGLGFFYIRMGVLLLKNKGTAEYDLNTIWLWIALILILVFFLVRNLLLVFAGVDYLGELTAYWQSSGHIM